MDKLKEFLKSDKCKALIACIAAVVMYFSPDHIDRVIETLLVLFGIERYVIKKKDDDTTENKKDSKEA